MSGQNNEVNLSTIEPAGGGSASAPGSSGPGKSKALRAEPKTDGEAAVFRLDALAPGAGGDGGAIAAPPPKARVSHAAIFFLVLIVVGGVMLFAMRKIGINPMSAIAKMKEPDVDLTKGPKSTLDHNRVLSDLSDSAVKSQVPIEQVQKNPFEIPEVVQAKASDDPVQAAKQAEERARKEADARKKRLDTTLASLKVHGILGGSNPVARINDQAVRVGDLVAEMFIVKSIHGRAVELEFDEQVFTITLDDDGGAKKPAPRRK